MSTAQKKAHILDTAKPSCEVTLTNKNQWTLPESGKLSL